MRTPIKLIRTLTLTIALFTVAGMTLSALPAEAQRSGGGSSGGSGGGRPPGGGGGGGGRPPSGGGGHNGGGHHGGGGHHHGGRHYGGYYGYYGGYWGPYWGWGGYWGPYWGGTVVYSGGSTVDSSRYATVDTDVSPEEAELYLDGRYIGTADDFDGFPDYLYLRPGKYTLEFRHPAYETLSVPINARRGQRMTLEQDLKLLPGKGKLSYFDPPDRGTPYGRVFGPGGAAEEVDAWREGTPPAVGGESVEGDPRYSLEARPDSGQDQPPPVKQPSGTRPDVAYILWKVEPKDAAVYLDDRYVGVAEDLNSFAMRGMVTEPGPHTVVVTRPGFVPKSIKITPKAGEKADVAVTLEKAPN